MKLGDVISVANTEKCGNRTFPVLSMTMHDGLILQTDRFKKTIASKDLSNYKVVRRNQLVVSFPIDEGVLYIQDVTNAGIVSPAYAVWDVDTKIVRPRFLGMFLRCPMCIQHYKAKLRGSTARRRTIPREDFLAMKIPTFTITEQDRICLVVEKIESVIKTSGKQMQLLQHLVKSRFVEMFGENQEWERVGLLDVGKCKNGINFAPNECGYEIHCIGVGNFKDFAEISNVESTPLVSLSQRPSDDLLLRDGDMLFVRSNGNKSLVGRCVVVRPGDTEVTFSGFCIRYRVTLEKLDPFYLVHFLRQSQVRRLLQGRGANIQNMSQRTLAGLTIPLPPLALQREFAAFVAKVDKLAFAARKRRDAAKQLYRAKIQEFFG